MAAFDLVQKEIEQAVTQFVPRGKDPLSDDISRLFEDCKRTIRYISLFTSETIDFPLKEPKVRNKGLEAEAILERYWGYIPPACDNSAERDLKAEDTTFPTSNEIKQKTVPNILGTEGRSNIAKIFPEFPHVDILKRIFSSKLEESLKILPYLLTAYYLYAIESGSVLTENGREIVLNANKSDSNYRYWVKRLCNSFSLSNYSDNQVLAVRGEYRSEIRNINNFKTFKNELSSPTKKKYHELHAASVIQAFLYSMFAYLCSKHSLVSEKVDYMQSLRLFNKHTGAFCVGFCPVLRPVEPNDIGNSLSTLLNIIKESEKMKFQGSLLDDEMSDVDNAKRITNAYNWCQYLFEKSEEKGVFLPPAQYRWKTSFMAWKEKKELSVSELYQLQAITHFIYLNPLMEMGPFWPMLRPEQYTDTIWLGAPTFPSDSVKIDSPQAYWADINERVIKTKKVMSWDRVRPLLCRGGLQPKKRTLLDSR